MAGPQQQLCWQRRSGRCTEPHPPARSSPLQAPRAAACATVRCQSHAERPRGWADATSADGSRRPISPSLQAGGDGEHGCAPGTLTRRVWDAFEVCCGDPAGVRCLCLSCLGPEQGSRVGRQQMRQVSTKSHVAPVGSIQMLRVEEWEQTPRGGTSPALAGSQCLGDRAAVLPSRWPRSAPAGAAERALGG